jgi:hypothetical protein
MGGKRTHYIEKHRIFFFLVASKETGLKVNSNKTKCMVMFRDQNAG